VEFDKKDIVRHKLVSRIVEAYEEQANAWRNGMPSSLEGREENHEQNQSTTNNSL
jgi:hypothetical protein